LKTELKKLQVRTSGLKAALQERLCETLLSDEAAALAFLSDSTVAAGGVVYPKGYCKNEHIMAQARL
jgi:hypothetical protein